MNNFDNFVDEYNDFVLQAFSCLSELPDPAETEHEFDSFTLRVEVKARIHLNQSSWDNSSA